MTLDANSLLQSAQQVAGGQQYPTGALYLVATPIGNMADLTLRAVHVLHLVDAVACEDTRVTGQLLRHLGLDKKLISLHQHNEVSAAGGVLALLAQGLRVAYVSDAGTPAVSDPGAHLVQAVREASHLVVPIPGASSVVSAISVAGDAQAHGFRFEGFLPHKTAARHARLQALAHSESSVVLFEAPHRIESLAQALIQVSPAGTVTVCRELTKQFEEIATMPMTDLLSWLAAHPHRQRGEFVLVWHAAPQDDSAVALTSAQTELLRVLSQHVPIKLAANLLAEVTGQSRKVLYDIALAWRQAAEE